MYTQVCIYIYINGHLCVYICTYKYTSSCLICTYRYKYRHRYLYIHRHIGAIRKGLCVCDDIRHVDTHTHITHNTHTHTHTHNTHTQTHTHNTHTQTHTHTISFSFSLSFSFTITHAHTHTHTHTHTHRGNTWGWHDPSSRWCSSGPCRRDARHDLYSRRTVFIRKLLRCVAVCCSVMQCVAVCYIGLQS